MVPAFRLAPHADFLMRVMICILGLLLAGCAHDKQVARKTELYEQPLVSPGAKFTGLPSSVQNTVRAQAGAAEIVALRKQTNADLVVYQFYFRNAGVNPPLFVAADGSVLKPDYSVAVGAASEHIGVGTGGSVAGLKLSDVPPNVLATIHDRAPNAEVAYIRKETRGDQAVFIITFKDETNHPAMEIKSNGSLAPSIDESGLEAE